MKVRKANLCNNRMVKKISYISLNPCSSIMPLESYSEEPVSTQPLDAAS